MRSASRLHRRRRERGAAMTYTVLTLLGLMSVTAIGIDLGRLAFTATEVQTAAEVAATAGAMHLLEGNDAQAGAVLALGGNQIDGQSAVPSLSTIETGNFDGVAFSAGGTPTNAVRATVVEDIDNLLAGLIGAPTSEVTKIATAAFLGLGGGEADVPLALCDCAFSEDCLGADCQPVWTHPTWTQTAAWTGFDAGHSTSDIRSFIPSACPVTGGGPSGGGEPPPELTVGDTIDVTNGTGSPPYRLVRCMVCDLGMCTEANPCLVPVFDCGSCPVGPTSGDQTVVGFAEVVIDSFHCTGGGASGSACPCGTNVQGSVDGMSFRSVFRTTAPGPPGDGNFGLGFVALVE